MVDEKIKTVETPVEDAPAVETPAEETTPQTDSEFMEEAIGEIKTTQAAILEEEPPVDTPVEEKTDDTPIEELAGTDIPDVFSEAAEALEMTPAEIKQIADRHTDAELLEMVPILQSAAEPELEEPVSEEVKPEDKPNLVLGEADPDMEQQIVDRVTQQLAEKFGASLEDIQQFKEQQAAQQEAKMLETANQKFDDAAEEFSIFGKTEELPRFTTGRLAGQFIPTTPAYKARLEVVKKADAFVAAGSTIDEAMDDALAWYAGKHLRTEMERGVIKDLKKHEQRLSGGRVGKETKKKHADSRDEIIDDIRQMQKQAGIDV